MDKRQNTVFGCLSEIHIGIIVISSEHFQQQLRLSYWNLTTFWVHL